MPSHASADWDGSVACSSKLPEAAHYQGTVLRFLARFASPETRRTYHTTLRDLGAFLCVIKGQTDLDLTSITEDDLVLWRSVREKHLKSVTASHSTDAARSATLARDMCAVRSFFRYAAARRFVSENPAQHLDPPRVRRSSRTASLSPSECGKILETLDRARGANNQRQARAARLAYAIFLTLATTGLRVAEICSLRVGDFRNATGREPARLTVVRKGGRIQVIHLHEMTRNVLTTYLEQDRMLPSNVVEPDAAGPHNPEFAEPSPEPSQQPFFVRSQRTRSMTPLTPKAIGLMLAKAAVDAGLDRPLSPHVLRATLATQLHTQGILLHQIQDLLGHSSVTTTSLYVKRLRDARASASPRLRLVIDKDDK